MSVKLLDLTSPHMKGKPVKDAQWLLKGNNRFQHTDHPVHPYGGPIDGDYGEATAHAADRARYILGYPKNRIPGGHFGTELRSYLIKKGAPGANPLPKMYNIRRYARLKLEAQRAKKKKEQLTKSVKSRALTLAKTQIGYQETGRNYTKYGTWYGFNGVPWCAIFVSWALNHSGKNIKTALAYQWEYWARAKQHGLSITYNPEPGDIVVYHNGEGHTGFFDHWIDRGAGTFYAVEGNELNQVMHKERNVHSLPTVFVRVT